VGRCREVWWKSPGNFAEKAHPLQPLIAFNIPVRWVFLPSGLKAD
jgi:hypothetical protein